MDEDDDNIVPLEQRPSRKGSLIQVGGPIDSVRVTLAIYGEHLDPDWVSHALGVAAAQSYRKGDPRRGDGMPPHRGGGWFLEEVGDAPADPESLTLALLQRLPGADAPVWAQLAHHYDVQLRYGLFVYGWNRGFDLSAELTRHIAQVGAKLVFDVYAQ